MAEAEIDQAVPWFRTPRGLAIVGGGAFVIGSIVGMATAGGDESDPGRPLPTTTTSTSSTTSSTTSTTTSATTSSSSTTVAPTTSSSTSAPAAPEPGPGPGPTVPDIPTTTLLGDP